MSVLISFRLSLCSAVAALALGAPAMAIAPPPLAPYAVHQAAYSQVVRDLQTELNARGYDAGPVDGYFGSKTGMAIRAYQQDNGLLVNGQPSAALLDHLRSTEVRSRSGTDDDRSERMIESAQERLASLGYSIRPTGALDWQTRLAVSEYQRDNNLPVDGELDRDLAQHVRDRAASSGGLSSAQLTDIERGLSARGYDVGEIDGRVDAQTRTAIRAYQNDRGGAVTGEVSRALAEQLSVGLGPSLNTPETIASVQSKLNAAGYDAGPADGVMGPSTRTAIQAYRADKNLGSSTAITEDLVASLNQSTSSGATSDGDAISFRLLMQDDFEDGDFTGNPNWQVHAGEFEVARGYLTVKLPDVQARSSAAQNPGISQFLQHALGVEVRSPDEVAAIAQRTGLENAFKLELTLLGSANQLVQMHFGPYVGSDLTSGYRLVFDQASNNRLALVVRMRGETVTLAEKFGAEELGDGRRHAVEWVRNQNGLMVVSVDGDPYLRVKDQTISGTFSGVSFVNLAGTWNIHDIAAYAYQE